MALNTATGRFSMLNLGSPIVFPLIIPDGTIAKKDRFHLLNLYDVTAVTVTKDKYIGFIINCGRFMRRG